MAEQFDPRYDPAFQPGFEASRHGSESRRRPVELPETSGDAGSSGSTSLREAAGLAPAEPPVADEPQDLPQLPEPHPFERTLWAVAAGLVVVGVVVAFWANSDEGTGAVWGWPQVLRSSAWVLVTPMVTVGLAVGVGLLFRRAITWKSEE